MKRILLFLLTNLAVILVISVIFSVFGIGQVLDDQGVNLDLQSLCLLYTSPSPRDATLSRMPSSA